MSYDRLIDSDARKVTDDLMEMQTLNQNDYIAFIHESRVGYDPNPFCARVKSPLPEQYCHVLLPPGVSCVTNKPQILHDS
jgi:hypothetical protein